MISGSNNTANMSTVTLGGGIPMGAAVIQRIGTRLHCIHIYAIEFITHKIVTVGDLVTLAETTAESRVEVVDACRLVE